MKLLNLRISIGTTITSLKPNDTFNDFYKYIVSSIYDVELSEIESSVSLLNISTKNPIIPQWEEFENSILSILNDETLPNIFLLIHITDIIIPTNYYDAIARYDKVRNEFKNIKIKTIIYLENESNVLSVKKNLLSLITNISFNIGVAGEYVFLNNDGEYTISDSEKSNISGFKDHIKDTLLGNEEVLKLKLIRRIGHFIKIKDGNHISCQKYFYDGSYCREEIIHILYEQIIDNIDKNKSFGVCFQSNKTTNDWAVSCFYNIFEKLKENFSGICCEKILTDEFDNVEQVILLMGIVSETTFRNKFNKIKSKIKSNVIPFCIIYCEEDYYSNDDKVKGEVSIVNSNPSIQLHYLLKRRQQYIKKETDKCIMCRDNLDIDRKYFNNQDSNPTLSSFEMWSVVIESGVIEEIIIPELNTKTERFPHRIPNTLNVVRYNGAYLASKFKLLLEENSLEFSQSGYIAYPDETNNPFSHHKNLTADEVPSSLFVSSLKLMYRYNRLPIPRKLIEEIKENPSNLENIKTVYSDFYKDLLRTGNEPIIIVDEFPRSYRTYDAMRKILSIEEKIPIAYVTLFNFSPDQAKEKVKFPIKHLNFYEFQIGKNLE